MSDARIDERRCRAWAEARGLVPCAEASDLVTIGEDAIGRPIRMTPDCAERFAAMQAAAARDGIDLFVVSAFRSVDHQRGIFLRKLERGEALEAILRVNAAPGYSEHHGGRALDLGTPGCDDLTERFEETAAFAWLRENAGRFGFALSYPRDNPHGLDYEPWHWALRPAADRETAS